MNSILTFRTALVAHILLALLALGATSVAQVPNAGRPQKIVNWKMNHLPKGLHLQAKQTEQLRKVFLVAAKKEQEAILAGGGRFRERAAIRTISLDLMAQERKILTLRQYRLLEGAAANP